MEIYSFQHVYSFRSVATHSAHGVVDHTVCFISLLTHLSDVNRKGPSEMTKVGGFMHTVNVSF